MNNPLPVVIMMSAMAALAQPAMAGEAVAPAPSSAPFTATLSNNIPLAFGMDATTAATALHVPLTYVRGKPGNEIFLAIRDIGGSGFFPRRDRLFLQFRHGRLTGWKGDWGRNWMWR
jgi:hypothetical protein